MSATSQSGAVSGLRAARDSKLCCSLRFPGSAPTPLVHVATLPRPRNTSPPTHPAAPRFFSGWNPLGGENFKAPDRRLLAYFPTGNFRLNA